jgi:hypothetical protein
LPMLRVGGRFIDVADQVHQKFVVEFVHYPADHPSRCAQGVPALLYHVAGRYCR